MSRTKLRITSGELRGRRLEAPAGVRPTEGRVREALFSIWWERVVRAEILDLFAGSGAVGIEALSRGAARAVFVDQAPRVLQALKKNVEGLPRGAATIVRGRLPEALGRRVEDPFDLVFADPPYAFDAYVELIRAVAPRLRDDGEVVVEHAARRELPPEVGQLIRHDVRRYGECSLSFYARCATGGGKVR